MNINIVLPVDFADEGQWRSWELDTQGASMAELIANATIAEIDQDGGELNCYGLEDASNEVANAAMTAIEEVIGELAVEEYKASIKEQSCA
jgi:hypothetical protein